MENANCSGHINFSLFSSPDELKAKGQFRQNYRNEYAGVTMPKWDIDLIPVKNENVENEIMQLIQSANRPPPTGYVCNECKTVSDHYTDHCPQAKHVGLTPYEGRNRSFGLFSCPHCHKNWYSYDSYTNVGEECKKCRRGQVFPKKQYDLKNEKKIQEIISKFKSKPRSH